MSVMTDDIYRFGVLQFATGQWGNDDPSPYWRDCGHEPTPEILRLAWCGVFALWCLRQAQLTTRKWELGHGFIYQSTGNPLLSLAPIETARPGDILFAEHPNQHYALVLAPLTDTLPVLPVIAGNSNGKVRSYSVTPSHAYTVFSLENLLEAKREPAV